MHELEGIGRELRERYDTDLAERQYQLGQGVQVWTTTDGRYAVLAPGGADLRLTLQALRRDLDAAEEIAQEYARSIGVMREESASWDT